MRPIFTIEKFTQHNDFNDFRIILKSSLVSHEFKIVDLIIVVLMLKDPVLKNQTDMNLRKEDG